MVRAKSRVSGVVVSGPLEPFVDAYRLKLVSLGYTQRSVVPQVRQVGRLSAWLQGQELTVAELGEDQVKAFLAVQRADGRHRSEWSRPGLLCLLEVLRELRAAAVPPHVPTGSDSEVLLGLFERYLLDERGLAVGTVAGYVAHARRFLGGLASLELHELGASEVTAAVLREVDRGVSVSAAQNFVAGLRAFLRYCFVEGQLSTDLAAAALWVTGRRRSPLPQGISRGQARALLDSCDRRTALGRRDYAIILSLLRLGLRRGELAAVTLDDLDWRAGEVVIHGKGGRVDRLPVPPDVGAAIAAYLCRGRRPAPTGSCSCKPERRSRRSTPARWPPRCGGPAGAPGSRRWVRTGCGTRWHARWSTPASPDPDRSGVETSEPAEHRDLRTRRCRTTS